MFVLITKVDDEKCLIPVSPRLRSRPMVSDQTVPDKSDLWSDQPRLNCPMIRLLCAQNSLSDQISVRANPPLMTELRSKLPFVRLKSFIS